MTLHVITASAQKRFQRVGQQFDSRDTECLVPVFDVVESLVDQVILNGVSSGNGLSFVSAEAISECGERSEYTFACDSGRTILVRAYKVDWVGGPFIDRFVLAEAHRIFK